MLCRLRTMERDAKSLVQEEIMTHVDVSEWIGIAPLVEVVPVD